VPHYISVAYHPNWRAEGAFGVFLASPSFMMVVPQQPVVRLRFARSATDWMGILATLAGIGLCFAMPRQSAETSTGLPPVASRRFRLGMRVILALALVVIAVSVIRKIGSQYFGRRAWHAFELQDFARARREYDRTLLFGRTYASSADAMFWRASSLFRMDDCAAAVPAYEELIARAPESVWAPESQYQIGICLARLGQHGSAAAAFQRTVERYEHNRWSDAAADRLREIHTPATGTR
jgi:tetratricopeptide (TPR) repeat protein